VNSATVPTPPVAVVVVPCYDERDRLDLGEVAELLEDRRLHVLFVDDGSSDGTDQLLAEVKRGHPDQVHVQRLPSNRGKAEAVRQGLLTALRTSPGYVGYLDADFATPAVEFRRLLDVISASPELGAVLGSRVAMLGTEIDRGALRHYLGRVFATAASLVLDMDVYDTQCGAKVFRTSPRLQEVLRQPFTSRWVFDVELLSRLTGGGYDSAPLGLDALREVPLRRWHDVGGSKVSPLEAVRMAQDLRTVWRTRRRTRPTGSGDPDGDRYDTKRVRPSQ
jgi:glycosyltransferase involved in cell wall biosynthesis